MGSTFLSLHYHIVFSTKERRPFIRDSWRAKMHEYLGGTVRGLAEFPRPLAEWPITFTCSSVCARRIASRISCRS